MDTSATLPPFDLRPDHRSTLRLNSHAEVNLPAIYGILGILTTANEPRRLQAQTMYDVTFNSIAARFPGVHLTYTRMTRTMQRVQPTVTLQEETFARDFSEFELKPCTSIYQLSRIVNTE
jgi:hypothetical protein